MIIVYRNYGRGLKEKSKFSLNILKSKLFDSVAISLVVILALNFITQNEGKGSLDNCYGGGITFTLDYAYDILSWV
jgi:hypothetical protein